MARESAAQKLARMTVIERELWAKGMAVAGIDEVGRGPLCGPVMSACIVIPEDALILGVDDSKKLSESKREALYDELMACASYVQTASVSAEEIDEIGIVEATMRTMQRASAELSGAFFLVDAVKGLKLPGASRSIIHGDALSYMIAAASIVAKVRRDRYMQVLHERYPMYNFRKHKGYGTAEHIAALREYGPCPEHRRTFIQKIMEGTQR